MSSHETNTIFIPSSSASAPASDGGYFIMVFTRSGVFSGRISIVFFALIFTIVMHNDYNMPTRFATPQNIWRWVPQGSMFGPLLFTLYTANTTRIMRLIISYTTTWHTATKCQLDLFIKTAVNQLNAPNFALTVV